VNGTKPANGSDGKATGVDSEPATAENVSQRSLKASVEEADDE
jgi:hypothetical protein